MFGIFNVASVLPVCLVVCVVCGVVVWCVFGVLFSGVCGTSFMGV